MDDAGREVGRLTGNPGERWFYPEIDRLVEELQAERQGAIAHGTLMAAEPHAKVPATAGAPAAPR